MSTPPPRFPADLVNALCAVLAGQRRDDRNALQLDYRPAPAERPSRRA